MGGPVRVIKRQIENLVRGNAAFFRRQGSAIPEIIKNLHENRVVLIDIPDMGERSELFVLSVITRMIMDTHRSEARGFGIDEKQEAGHQVLITIEEAQRVLASGGSSTQIFRECAMEGRKFGVGLCVITQQPKNVDPKVLAQINTFVVMGLGDRGDREIIMGSAKQDLRKWRSRSRPSTGARRSSPPSASPSRSAPGSISTRITSRSSTPKRRYP